jgi:cobalt/nickel transport system ATP-binding protein
MENMIFELNRVDYSYFGKFPALRGLDFSVEAGSKSVLLGANGTGKSTLLYLLDGLIFPDKGSLKFRGKELTETLLADPAYSRDFRNSVGFVFQNPDVQLFCPTVKEDIIFGPLQLGMDKEEIIRQLDRLADIFKITGLLERQPHQLSIGEKKKVAIASVLAVEPDVLLLDEPTAGLDPQTTRDIIDILLELNQAGKTIITATHDLHIAGEIADKAYIFGSEKTIIKNAPCREVLSDEEFLHQHNLAHIHRHSHEGVVHSHSHKHLEHHK